MEERAKLFADDWEKLLKITRRQVPEEEGQESRCEVSRRAAHDASAEAGAFFVGGRSGAEHGS